MTQDSPVKYALGKSWKFWFILLVIYFLIVMIEEFVYKSLKSDWKTFTSDNSPLLNNHINALATDGEGWIWIGTEEGLYAIQPDASWITYTKENSSLPNDQIRALVIDDTGNIWVGTEHGLYVLKKDSRVIYPAPENKSFSNARIQDLLVDNQNRVWAGTYDGLYLFNADGKTRIHTPENSDLVENSVQTLGIDRFNRVWIGTNEGVSMLDESGAWVSYQKDHDQKNENQLVGNDITAFLFDHQDRVWIGTGGRGISILDTEGNWTSYSINTQSPFPDGNVRDLVMDKEGRIWVGMLQQLSLYGIDGQWSVYTIENSGLPDNNVKALLVDMSDHLWVGTSSGLSVIDLHNEPPRIIPDSWNTIRTMVLFPILLTIAAGNFSLEILHVIEDYLIYYCLFLVLIAASIRAIYVNRKDGDAMVLGISITTIILSVIGVILLCVFIYIAGIMSA